MGNFENDRFIQYYENLIDFEERRVPYEVLLERVESLLAKTHSLLREEEYRGNLAMDTHSVELSGKTIKYTLSCGKLNVLHTNYLTIVCAWINDSEKREICEAMLKKCYYLSELAMNEKKRVLYWIIMKKSLESGCFVNAIPPKQIQQRTGSILEVISSLNKSIQKHNN